MRLSIPPVLQLAVCCLIAWALVRFFPSLSYDSYAVWLTGCLLIAFGAALLIAALGLFTTCGTTINPMTPEQSNLLVTSGLYRWSRNPMYVAMAAVLMGYTLLLLNLASLVSVPIFVISITSLQIRPEEQVLRAKFGEQFDAYQKSTARWI